MPDFGTPVAQNVNPVGQGLTTLSDLMNVKRQQQALQTGQYQQQSAQAAAQQDQQKNQELQSLSQFTQRASKDPAYHNPDGSLNVQKFQTDASAVAPTYGQDYIGKATLNANASIDNRKALLGLSEDQRKSMGSYFNSVASNPNATVEDFTTAVDRARTLSDDPNYQKSLDRMLVSYPHSPSASDAQSSQATRQFAAGIASQTSGASITSPSTVDNGASIQPGATNRYTGTFTPSGAPIAKQVSPGAQVVKDAYDNQYVWDPQTNRVTPIGGGKGSSTGAAQSGPGFRQPVAGQQQVLQDVENARAVGDQAPAVRNVNQQLLQLSSDTKTGPGTQTIQKAAAMLGLPSGSSYQEINAYLDRQAAMSARQMGVPNTNAGLAASQSATGTTEYTPKALQEKVKFADALNSSAMAYRQGLDKAVGTGPQPDLSKYQAFRGAWAQNFDPDVFRVEDAQRRGDQAELASIKQRLGPQGMRALFQKSANLRSLENGQIPQ